MTREKAIGRIIGYLTDYLPSDQYEEVEEIIKALEQEPCEDCISRKALLEEVENGIKAGNYEEGYEEYAHINDMDDIIECIKYADSVQPKAEQEPCEDAISRQSAIFLANDLKEDLPDDEHIADIALAHNEGILEYQTKLSLLPSVKSQQKTGHWIVEVWNNREHHSCSVCQRIVDYEPCYHYCPYCGAKMVEPQESEVDE